MRENGTQRQAESETQELQRDTGVLNGAETENPAEQRETTEEVEGVGEKAPEEEAAALAAALAGVAEEQSAAESAEQAADGKKDAKERQIDELKDRLRRNLAEFDNYRKRTEKEKSAMFDLGARNVLEKLLPVIDNFERSIGTAPDAPELRAYADGMEMIYRQLLKNMEEAGVRPMEAKGKPFDPELHNAVMHVEDEAFGENEVAEELQKGYFYKDSVLRHSMVKVAN